MALIYFHSFSIHNPPVHLAIVPIPLSIPQQHPHTPGLCKHYASRADPSLKTVHTPKDCLTKLAKPCLIIEAETDNRSAVFSANFSIYSIYKGND